MRGPRPIKREAAGNWLWAYLSGGKRSTEEIEKVGASQGYGWRTLEKCKAARGISSVKVGHGWYWRRPDIAEPKAEEITLADVMKKLNDQPSTGAIAAVAAVPVAAPVIDPEPEPPFQPSVEVWSDADYEASSYEEIADRLRMLEEDLSEAQKYHGKKRGLKTIDNSLTISALEQEIVPAKKWYLVKANEKGVF